MRMNMLSVQRNEHIFVTQPTQKILLFIFNFIIKFNENLFSLVV